MSSLGRLEEKTLPKLDTLLVVLAKLLDKDLAVEAGFLRFSELQKEIMWLCEAVHVPVIWARKVPDTLVKKRIPTRAEITDATMGGRAECVMFK